MEAIDIGPPHLVGDLNISSTMKTGSFEPVFLFAQKPELPFNMKPSVNYTKEDRWRVSFYRL